MAEPTVRVAGVDAWAALPSPHSGVQFCVNTRRDDCFDFQVWYVATPEALIASGVATLPMLGRGKPSKSRFDEDGRQFRIYRSSVTTKLVRYKSESDALTLPGVTRGILLEAQRRNARFLEIEQQRGNVATSSNAPRGDSQIAGPDLAAVEEQLEAAMDCIKANVKTLLTNVGCRMHVSAQDQYYVSSAVGFLDYQLGAAIRGATAKPCLKPALRLVVDNTKH